MLRDEIDILEDWLSHHLKLVDSLLVADHLSTDGSREVLRAFAASEPRLEVFSYDYEPYFQSQVITALVQRAATGGATWVLPLDVDEFLPHSSSEDLKNSLCKSDQPLIRFYWQNLVPEKIPLHRHRVDWSQPFLTLREPSVIGKVAIAGSLVMKHSGLRVLQGSHDIELKGVSVAESSSAGRLWHIPVRSREQAIMKFENGSSAYEKILRRSKKLGRHWFQLRSEFQGNLSEEQVMAIGLHYGKESWEKEVGEVLTVAFRPLRSSVAIHDVRPVSERIAQAFLFNSDEVRVFIVGGSIELRARRFWRTRRVYLRVTQVLARLVKSGARRATSF